MTLRIVGLMAAALASYGLLTARKAAAESADAAAKAAAPEAKRPSLPRPTSPLVFPDDAGHVDVRKQYGARGDGATDDTAALNKAISEHLDYHSRMLWLGNGTYLVSDTLISRTPDGKPMFGVQILGQSVEKTVIRLKDNAPGFQDPSKPKALLKMCSRNQLDGGNMGHKNFLHNLTVDTGKGNPGAVAIDYTASNTGAIRDVWFRSGDGAGVMGIDLTKPWPGPCLITNVQVSGFDYGIRIRHPEYSVTFEHIKLERQRVCGLKNEGNVVCMRRLQSRNAGPAVDSQGMLILLDSELHGAGDAEPAIHGGGPVYLRNVRASGYGGVYKGGGAEVGEFVSGRLKSLFPSPAASLNLPVEDTPFVPYDPPELWVRASGNVQAAIDKGASTVYIPFGEYRYDKTIVIRGPVRRLHALNANVWAGKGLGDAPLFRFEGAAKACVMEWMDSGTVEHASPNALVIRDCTGLAPATTPNCGPTFVENDCSDHWTLRGPARVYGRSVNLEHADFDIRNLGAALWILGFKSERPGLQVETRDGGFTEILGGLVYPCAAVPADRPMFVNHESSLSVMIRQNSYVANGIHRIKVQETRDGETRNLEEIGENLYVGYKVPPRLADKGYAAGKREETKKEEKTDKPADVGASKPAAPKPVATAEAVAAWDAKLKARLQEELKEGRKPKFTFAMLGQECRLAAIDGKDAIRILSGGSAMDLAWKALTLEDRKGLVMGLLREDRADDIALAAFFHLAAGDVEKGQVFLARAGSAGEPVRAAFR